MGSTAMLMCLYTMDGTKKENTLISIVVHGKEQKKWTGMNDSGRLIKIITIN